MRSLRRAGEPVARRVCFRRRAAGGVHVPHAREATLAVVVVLPDVLGRRLLRREVAPMHRDGSHALRNRRKFGEAHPHERVAEPVPCIDLVRDDIPGGIREPEVRTIVRRTLQVTESACEFGHLDECLKVRECCRAGVACRTKCRFARLQERQERVRGAHRVVVSLHAVGGLHTIVHSNLVVVTVPRPVQRGTVADSETAFIRFVCSYICRGPPL